MAVEPDEVLEVAADGDAQELRRLLAEDPDVANARGWAIASTPLIVAAHRGHEEVVRLLLDAGADVHGEELPSGTTALHWAAEGGHARIAGWLLEAGARGDRADRWFGLAPLGWACVIECAPAFHDDRETTALMLVARGVPVDPFSAVALGRLDDLEAADVARRLGFARQAMTPLHLAVERGDAAAVERLVELGAPLDARTDWGLTPSDLAALAGAYELHAILASAGAPPDVVSQLAAGEPVAAVPEGLVHAAARRGRADVVRGALAQGATIEGRVRVLAGDDPCTVTALFLAALRGHLEAARSLLDAGAEPSAAADPSGLTPLHVAAARGDGALAGELVRAGADRGARDADQGATPADWAALRGHEELARQLSP